MVNYLQQTKTGFFDNQKPRPKMQISDDAKKAAEDVLSGGRSVTFVPLKDGGIRVRQEISETVYIQSGKSNQNNVR